MEFRKITTFISSSMQGNQWLELRESIRNELNSTNIIDTFIIEDTSATLPSMLTYKVEIEMRDIVVFIFDDKLSPAVKDEFDIAFKNKKKMLMFFKECQRELELEEFNNMVIKMDCCTYKTFKSFEDLKNQIQTSLVNDILRIYQYYCRGFLSITDGFNSQKDYENITSSAILNKDQLSIYSLDKKYLEKFSECKDKLWKSLGLPFVEEKDIKPVSPIGMLGTSLLNWVVGRDLFPGKMLQEVSNDIISMNGEAWIEYRLNAVHSYFGYYNIDSVINYLKKSKEIAVKCGTAPWIVNDILIDIRNMEFVKMNNEGVYYESTVQKEISSSKSEVFFPYLDRLHANFNDKIFNEFFDRRTSSIYTQHLGGNLNSVINDLENIVFVSICYGSITHLSMVREYLAKVMFMYSETYKSEELIYKSLRMYILNGDTKLTRKILESHWGKFNIELQKELSKIWSLTESIITPTQKENMKALLFEKLGYYFNDLVFENYLSEIFELAYSEKYLDSRISSSLKAIQKNMLRIDSQRVVDLVIKYFNRGWIRVIENLYQLLDRVNWDEVDIKRREIVIQKVTGFLFEKPVGYAVENRLVISMRKSLEKETNHWDNLVEEKWNDLEKQIFRFETKNVNLSEALGALQENINTLINRNLEMGKNGTYPMWASKPLKIIMAIIDNYKSIDTFNFVTQKLFEVIFNILLNEKQTYSEKTSCIKTLMQIKTLFEQEEYSYEWDSLAQEVEKQYSNILTAFEFGFGDIGSKSTLEINILAFLSMCGRGSIESIILRFIELSNEGTIEELELVKCLSEFVKNNKQADDIALANILTILMQKSLHDVFEVRWYVAEALWNLTNTRLKGYIHAKIYSLSEDPNYFLRHKIIGLAQEMYKEDPINAGLVLRKGINDSNFVVRNKAKQAIKELNL